VLFTTGYTRNAIVHNGVLESGTQLLPSRSALTTWRQSSGRCWMNT